MKTQPSLSCSFAVCRAASRAVSGSLYNIFGEEFVKNNKDNIELEINGEKNNLINKYKLRKGENKIKMKIKKRIKDLGNMFYECKNLKNINELKYLNTK